jgi:hypothetical protein
MGKLVVPHEKAQWLVQPIGGASDGAAGVAERTVWWLVTTSTAAEWDSICRG